eukprot:m.66825 g.66825  ORF g.66825 m.66825 type:complete len:495 (+) comp23730_c0_seq1:260-1744(+)
MLPINLVWIVFLPSSAANEYHITPPNSTINLMTNDSLGEFFEEDWKGYACTFNDWTTCVNSSSTPCARSGSDTPAPTSSACQKCMSKRGRTQQSITCTQVGNQRWFYFPAGGIFPVTEQFTLPSNTAIVGAANPNNPTDKTRQQIDVSTHTWFVVTKKSALCGDDPLCKDKSASAPTACVGDPRTHRQGFLMSSNSTLKNINFQGADLGRAASEGTLCGPGAIELPGCLSGDGCDTWGGSANGDGVVHNVLIQNVRLSDAVKRADIKQMRGDCNTGEALDDDGQHVRAHQVSVWAAKLPKSELGSHSNVIIDNLVSMNSRADGLNIHGASKDLVLQNSHIENSGDDCIGVWSTGITNMTIENVTTANCAVTAGAQTNWGSCMGTYAFTSLVVRGLTCYDPFLSAKGCNPRTHYTAIHINHAFQEDCMPKGASLSLSRVAYVASEHPDLPLARAKCGQCRSCCGPCSFDGFDDLTIEYLDASVPNGSCKNVNAGC